VQWYDSPDTLHAEGTRIVQDGSVVLDASNTPLLGAHNLSNIAGALTVVRERGFDLLADRDLLEAALGTFTPLPHRLELVSRAGGAQWIDDGLATNPHAAIAALNSFPGKAVTLLVGGQDRGVDYTPLVDALLDRHEPTTVIAIPDNGKRVIDELRARAELHGKSIPTAVFDVDALEDAVKLAARETPAGGVVLLAPAAPSFGRFRDYLERSAAFLNAINEL